MSYAAALFVETDGIYRELGLDVWGGHMEGKRLIIDRDARHYDGPGPVIVHPPCERWGRYWGGGPSAKVKRSKGDDQGCFASALASVRRCGGVLEHPEGSHAWRAFDLPAPPQAGGWIRTICGGWTCCVAQGHYGHRSQKLTWLYAYGITPPPLRWGLAPGMMRLDAGYSSTEAARLARASGDVRPRIATSERRETPRAFAELLISLVRSVESVATAS
jgi:hypothetical protein